MPMTFDELVVSHCAAQEGKSAMAAADVTAQLTVLPEWRVDGARIRRTYKFANYWETIAFVNTIAFVFHREDHHPELQVRYDAVDVRFDTHSVDGLSPNDFVCAAKCDAIYAERPRAPSA